MPLNFESTLKLFAVEQRSHNDVMIISAIISGTMAGGRHR